MDATDLFATRRIKNVVGALDVYFWFAFVLRTTPSPSSGWWSSWCLSE